jgi:phosphatidylinositol alpha-mannosyltransferase
VGDGPLRGYYRNIAGDDPSITFIGSVDDRAGYYANSAIYACPTTRGASFGITLLEAMACERPIVCSDIPGFRNVVRNGQEALMVPRQNPDAMAHALIRLLDDETLRARMGKAGRQTALAYSWDRVTDAVLGVYADVLGETARPRLPLVRSLASSDE